MAFFMLPNVVEYACVCGLLSPLTKLYFCRYCLKIRCGFCVCHEVDSHFCCNCLENIPSSEAKIRKNRCNTCFNCPSCQHTLSEDPKFIVWRKANQISMKLAVQPAADCKPGDEVVIGFSLQYTYVSTAMDKNVTAASTTAGGTPGSGSSGAASAAATAATPRSTSTPTKGGPQKHALTTRVYLKLGRIAAVPEVAA
ncbi:hypothetical protein quinque_015466 [Culex quinquefasciatus]